MLASPAWYQPLAEITSLGSQTEPVGGLAGLAAARELHHGQFFTPSSVASYLWDLVAPSLLQWRQRQKRPATIFDSSIGSGRLIQFADHQCHSIFGIDTDGALIDRVESALRNAGFRCDLNHGSLETFRARGQADLAIINPPFSLHIDSPLVEPFPCTTWGTHHRHSSTISHLYAVHQACAWASCVVAILPLSAIDELTRCPASLPLARVYHLPPHPFRDEGANFATAVAVFTHHLARQRDVIPLTREDLSRRPEPLAITAFSSHTEPFALLRASSADGPVITTPVTGDRSVRIIRCGRRIVLRFACGLVEATTLNHLMVSRMDECGSPSEHRHHPSVAYVGQGWQDAENFIAQEDAGKAWDDFIGRIIDAGGIPTPDPGIRPYLVRRHRQLQRQRLPFGHVVYDPHAHVALNATATTRKNVVVGNRFGAPTVPAGTSVTLERLDDGFRLRYRGAEAVYPVDDARRLFRLEDTQGAWVEVHPAAHHRFPAIAAQVTAQARRLGIDRWLSWGFQWDDLIEARTKGGNALLAWEMGLGKARLALALAALGGRHNLIVVQAHLVDEMRREIAKLGIADSQWQVINSIDDTHSLRSINIITYNRLRMPIDRRVHERWTYAKLLRGRIHTCICDEVHVLCNPTSDQSQAVASLRARRRYGLTGTPIANYARDILPLLHWLGGDATALQPYGRTNPHMESRNLLDLTGNRRSVDVFSDLFVTFEWVTNEFRDDLRTGAKREVPRLRNATAFQRLLAPFCKRRIAAEPAVAKVLQIPVPEYRTITAPWDDAHLAHYLSVAEDFGQWFKNRENDSDRRNNLVALLARIGAVQAAANCPDVGTDVSPAYLPATTKHRILMERIREHLAGGHRMIVFAHRPATVERIGRMLADAGIEHLCYHGGMPTERRNALLYRHFVEGRTPVLVATYGSCQTGLNLHVADRVIFYERAWTPKAERQAAARVLRPQQRRPVLIEHLHLEGSIDEYQAQMVTNKQACVDLAIDHQGDEADFSDFIHLDTILARFVDDISSRFGCKRHELRDQLQKRPQAHVA